MKTALVLEGGAKRGIYTAGVLDVLLENGIMTDGVLGVSAGAIHGCSYVARQAGRSIRYNLKYGGDYRFMSFRSLLLSGNMVDTQFCYHELPEKLDPFDNETFMRSKRNFMQFVLMSRPAVRNTSFAVICLKTLTFCGLRHQCLLYRRLSKRVA